jgi:UDP-hydrolysing UDP-N-acetyl-D-glucosamine 2-epimerase
MNTTTPQKRKVCVVIINRANYGRVKTVLEAIQKNPALELQVVAGSSMLLERHGRAVDVVRTDGFPVHAEVHMVVEGEIPLTMAKSVGLGIIELTNALHQLKPDIVLTIADRYETMATAIAASYMNIPLAHVQGGEVTGSIDESVRHAVTKLAHLHFPATTQSAERLVKMGEQPSSVHCTGCPSIDLLARLDRGFTSEEIQHLHYAGVGSGINVLKPYALLVQHPVTTEYGSGYQQILETVEAVNAVGMQTIAL